MAERRREEARREVSKEEAGSKGGAMEAAFPPRVYVAEPEVEKGLWLKDRVRWGPIWAGLVIALTTQLLLSALGVAIGIQGLMPVPGAISTTAASTLGIWMAVSALISLFLGGLAAARFAGIAGTWNGVWNGVILWALALVLGTVAASLGASGLLGYFGRGFGGPFGAMPGMSATEAQRALAAASTGATWFIVGSILGLIAAAIGGAIGARAEVVDHTETASRAH
jgi:hypothetical protein